MTAFVNDEGEYLDYSGADVGVTRQVANFFDFKIKGEISATLNVSNNSKNRSVLGFFGTQQVDSPAYSKTPFNMVRDGNIISRGFIVVQSSDEDSISCFYISGNTNWFQDFQFNLKDIVFDDRFTVLGSDVNGRKSSTDGIVFPLVDYWAAGARNGADYLSIPTPTSAEEVATYQDVHPWLYLHTLVDEMSKYGGVTIGGDLIGKKIGGTVDTQDGDALYKKIIISPTGPEYYVPDSIVDLSYAKIQNGPFGSAGAGLYDYTLDPQLIRFSNVVDGQGQVNTSTYAFLVPNTGTYQIDLDFWVNVSDTYSVDLYVNGVLFSAIFNTGVVQNKVGTIYVNLVRGDSVQFYVNNSLAANYRLDVLGSQKYTNVSIKLAKVLGRVSPNISAYSGPSAAYIIPNAIVPDMKAIDLIKFLAFYFGCVVTYDEFSSTIEIDLVKNFRKEDAEDWSEYFVSSRVDFKTGVAAKNYIQFTDGQEEDIIAYNEQSNVSYGGGTIETPFDSLEEKTLYKVPFSPTWDTENRTKAKTFWPHVKFYEVTQEESVAFSGVTNNGGLAQFTSTFNEPLDFKNNVFYVISATGAYTGYAAMYTSVSSVTNPVLLMPYSVNDSGTIIRCTLSKVDGNNRMMVCQPGRNIPEIGGTTVTPYVGGVPGSSMSTACIGWFDKPKMSLPVDGYHDSLAIDSTKSQSNTISERYYGPIKKVFGNPKVVGEFRLPLSVFQKFDFKRYIYVKTKDLTGYFIVQKIENYRDALTPVKVELLYAD